MLYFEVAVGYKEPTLASPDARHAPLEGVTRCSATVKSGNPCRMRALPGEPTCLVHRPSNLAEDVPWKTRLDGDAQCTATTQAGVRCKMWAIRGGHVCIVHGGNSSLARRHADLKLLALVDPALAALEYAMAEAAKDRDWASVIKAATVLLDRAGRGPKATIILEEARTPLEDMSEAEMAALAGELQAELANRADNSDSKDKQGQSDPSVH